MRSERQCDVLVFGSGAGGLSAAVTTARHELDVIVAEKEDICNGASATYYAVGGINLGPAMTFGYIAGRALAAERKAA